MSRMRFCVMDVGQGSANFVQYFDSDAPTAIAKKAGLLDVGSEGWREEAGKPSARLIADELKKMDARWATLDEVMLSHSDSDHHNLVQTLLDGFHTPEDGRAPVLEVRRTWYGGQFDLYKKGKSTNVLRRLARYRPAGTTSKEVRKKFKSPWSSFDNPNQTTWRPVAKIGEIELWVLAANTTGATVSGAKKPKVELKDNGDGYSINTKSLVVAAKFGGMSMIATGDATGLTLAHAVNVLAKPGVKAKLGTVFMISAPHHGSDTTTYSLNGRKSKVGIALGKAVVKRFVDDLAPQTVSASAGQRSGFWHPSMDVLADFSRHLLNTPKYIDPVLHAMGTDEHFYTAYFDPETLDWKPLVAPPKPPPQPKGKKRKAPGDNGVPTKWPDEGGWKVARTAQNVFTTDYFYTFVDEQIPIAFPPEAKETPANLVYDQPLPPPNAVSWAFDVTDTGVTSVLAAFRRDELHPAQIAHVEALLGGPLPDDEFIWVPSAVPPSGPPDDQPTEPPDDQPTDDQTADDQTADDQTAQALAPSSAPTRDAVPSAVARPAPPGLGNARQIS